MMCSKKALVGTVRCRWAQIVVLTRVLIRVAAGRRWALLSAAGHYDLPRAKIVFGFLVLKLDYDY